ncbi:MAG: hypothetical protein GX465_18185 [Acidobacteria bacterium]|nr:hypothetical protein [Acidobacteriota bacterium]
MTTQKPPTSEKPRPRRDAPLDRLTSRIAPADRFEPTQEEVSADKKIFEQLRYLMLRSERLWLLDVDGDYAKYRMRLRALAGDYGIPFPPAKKPEA